MNIITKFTIGDTAFRLHQNKVQEVEVAHFQIDVKPGPVPFVGSNPPVVEICYTLKGDAVSVRDHENYEYEGTLFATKAELLASL